MNSIDIPLIETIEITVRKIKNKELKVYDLIKEHLDRANLVNKDINAFITVIDNALEIAKELDNKIENGDINLDNNTNLLLGIPFTVKDLYLVDGVRTTFGSKYMSDFIAVYTSTVVKKCLDQGAILIAKANCDPWGLGSSGENSGYGVTKHPLDLERTPGGSSSGSASGLLSGVGFFSLGTDTGGSVRLPASFTGLYGLKPTYGRNSRYGIGAMASSFDTPGFFTHNLEDMALLEGIMAGKDINDATTSEEPVVDYLEMLNSVDESNLKDITFGIAKEFFTEGLNPEIKEAIELKIDSLRNKGFKIKDISLPTSKYGLACYYILVPSEISSNRARYDGVRYGPYVSENYEDNLTLGRSKYFEDEVKRRIMIGTYSLSKGYSDQYYKKASKVREKIKNEFNNAFKEVDVIISPVSPNTAFKIGEKINDPIQMYLVDIFTVTANLAGIPAISIPIGKSTNGLPIGLQLMSKQFSEDTLFKAGKALISV